MADPLAIAVLVVGLLVLATTLLREWLVPRRIPPLVAYLVLGVLLRAAPAPLGDIGAPTGQALEFLGEVGIIVLLFRVGMDTDLRSLLGQLRTASRVWAGDVVVSGTVGYLAARYVVGLELVPSLVVATALTATSISISVPVWQEHRRLATPEGSRFLDVAELDDISGVVLFALLFSVLPELRQADSVAEVLPTLAATTAGFVARLVAFGAVVFTFSHLGEERLSAWFRRVTDQTDRTLLVVAVAFVIAALAAVLGFSVAIGAFFAGLSFSRNSERVRLESSFQPISQLFGPFFFIAIGLGVTLDGLGGAWMTGLVLLLAAVVGKLVGAGVPARLVGGDTASAVVLATSMVPRAEIAMVIASQARARGDDVLSDTTYTALVLTAVVTSVVAPLALDHLLSPARVNPTANEP